MKRIAVDPAYRGLGAGARLLAHAIRSLRLAGASHVELRSERGLGAAWRLFERFGFRRVGIDRRVYGYDVVGQP